MNKTALIMVRQKLGGKSWTFTNARQAIHYIAGHGKFGYEILVMPGPRLFRPTATTFEEMVSELETFIQSPPKSDPRQANPL